MSHRERSLARRLELALSFERNRHCQPSKRYWCTVRRIERARVLVPGVDPDLENNSEAEGLGEDGIVGFRDWSEWRQHAR